MKTKQQEGAQKTTKQAAAQPQGKWHEMNRKRRREMIRKVQSEDLSLEVVHPDAAGIDIGNESPMWRYLRAGTANRYDASDAPRRS